jgi:uncharacterized membrane protein YbaN (DUF454 family)
VRRIIIFVIGGTLLLLGLLGMVLPVLPGVIFIPLALAILAAEFAWAARWLIKIRRTATNMHQRVKHGWRSSTSGAVSIGRFVWFWRWRRGNPTTTDQSASDSLANKSYPNPANPHSEASTATSSSARPLEETRRDTV